MNTKKKLTEDLKDAMRAKDGVRKSTIRLALASIKNAEIENQAELEESAVLAILQKEVKARFETIEGAEQAQRDDLIAEAKAEIAVLEEYLPQPLSSEEIETIVADTIAEVGATSMREMGQVMQSVMPKVRGRADGKEVNQIVRKMLSP
ncbi:GatB/YqeY domain-containing protein [Chloroflexota bacterium]